MPVIPDKIQREMLGDKVVISWKNNEGSRPFFLAGFSALFIFIFYAISSIAFEGDVPFFVYIVAGFILLIFLFVMYKQISKTIKNYRTGFGFSISRQNFEYFEEDKAGNVKMSKVIPLKDIAGVYFKFQPSETLEQLTPFIVEVIDEKSAEKKGIGDEMKRLKKIFSPGISLDIMSLNATERLNLRDGCKINCNKHLFLDQ